MSDLLFTLSLVSVYVYGFCDWFVDPQQPVFHSLATGISLQPSV